MKESVVAGGIRSEAFNLFALEGRRVSISLTDGSRIDDCQLVSAPRGDLTRVWIYANGNDTFVLVSEISDAWEVPA